MRRNELIMCPACKGAQTKTEEQFMTIIQDYCEKFSPDAFLRLLDNLALTTGNSDNQTPEEILAELEDEGIDTKSAWSNFQYFKAELFGHWWDNLLHHYAPGYGYVLEMEWERSGVRHEPYEIAWLWRKFTTNDLLCVYWICYGDMSEGTRQVKMAGEYVGDLDWHWTDEEEGT